MALFNLFGSKKPVVKKTVPVKVAAKPATAKRVPNVLSGVDCYSYYGTVEDFFAEVLARNFPGYELRRNVALETIFAPSSGSHTATAAPVPAGTWKCACGTENKGAFCVECGAKKPEPKIVPANGPWVCGCGATNSGKFCPECGAPRPVSKEWVCACGKVNEGKFCPECGSPKPAGPAPVAAPAATPVYSAPVAVKVPDVKGGYAPLSFVLTQNGKPKMAIIICSKSAYNKKPIQNTMKFCEKNGIPCQRYFLEFRNDEAYIRNRINMVLR